LVKQRSETFCHILKDGDFAEREITKLDNPVIDVLKKAAIINIYHW